MKIFSLNPPLLPAHTTRSALPGLQKCYSPHTQDRITLQRPHFGNEAIPWNFQHLSEVKRFLQAVEDGNLQAVQGFVQQYPGKMDVFDPFDKQQQTALHLAVQHKKQDIVEALLAAKADVQGKDSDGKTALQFALLHYPENKLLCKRLREAEPFHTPITVRFPEGLYALRLTDKINKLYGLTQNETKDSVIQENSWQQAFHQAIQNAKQPSIDVEALAAQIRTIYQFKETLRSLVQTSLNSLKDVSSSTQALLPLQESIEALNKELERYNPPKYVQSPNFVLHLPTVVPLINRVNDQFETLFTGDNLPQNNTLAELRKNYQEIQQQATGLEKAYRQALQSVRRLTPDSDQTYYTGTFESKLLKVFTSLGEMIPNDAVAISFEYPQEYGASAPKPNGHIHILKISRLKSEHGAFLQIDYKDNETGQGIFSNVQQRFFLNLDNGEYLRHGISIVQGDKFVRNNPYLFLFQILYESLYLENKDVPNGHTVQKEERLGPILKTHYSDGRHVAQELRNGFTLPQLELWKSMEEAAGAWFPKRETWLENVKAVVKELSEPTSLDVHNG